MMSREKLQRITGHEPVTEHSSAGWLATCECACDGEPKIIVADAETTESGALSELLREVYAHHRFIACTKAGWRCEECSRVTGVSAHHRVHRSKGRSDAVGNLICLCSDCHEIAHK